MRDAGVEVANMSTSGQRSRGTGEEEEQEEEDQEDETDAFASRKRTAEEVSGP